MHIIRHWSKWCSTYPPFVSVTVVQHILSWLICSQHTATTSLTYQHPECAVSNMAASELPRKCIIAEYKSRLLAAIVWFYEVWCTEIQWSDMNTLPAQCLLCGVTSDVTLTVKHKKKILHWKSVWLLHNAMVNAETTWCTIFHKFIFWEQMPGFFCTTL